MDYIGLDRRRLLGSVSSRTWETVMPTSATIPFANMKLRRKEGELGNRIESKEVCYEKRFMFWCPRIAPPTPQCN